MSPAKHTPGPWQVSETVTGRPKVISSLGFAVCGFQSGAYEQMRKDARLIAAAPELLAAAIEARSAIRNQIEREQMHSPWLSQVFDLLDKSIAKATGEQA